MNITLNATYDVEKQMETCKILIVEDEGLAAIDLCTAIEDLGFPRPEHARSGEEALELVTQTEPDLVLMDIKIGGNLDGIGAASVILKSFNIPVIFLTAYADEETLARAVLAEPYGYILKPFDKTELKVSITVALHKHRKISQLKSPLYPTDIIPRSFPQIDSSPTSIMRFIKKIPFLEALPQSQLARLTSVSWVSVVKAGEIIACEGEELSSCFVVVQGRVALTKTSSNGKDLIVELLPPGDIFSLAYVLEQLPYPLTARAQTRSLLLSFPLYELRSLFEQHQELYRLFSEELMSRLKYSHDCSRALAHDSVEIRIATGLLKIISKLAIEPEGDESFLIPMTRQEIADLTGTTPETAIRTTKAMERNGLLDLSKPGLIRVLKREGLEDIAGTA
jgi:CRP-like cAMP-binding protein/AmiR/NasT family two-component response regulator